MEKNIENLKVAIVGLGAVGAIVAENLSNVLGNNLFCVLNKERLQKYEENGIFVNGKKLNLNFCAAENVPVCDYVILATKNLQTQEALLEVKNAVDSNTAILSLLNGIQSEKEIENTFSPQNALYGFILNLTSVNLNGRIEAASRGKIVFGEKDNSKSSRIEILRKLFEEAKIEYFIPEDIHLEMWKKFLVNCTFNSLGAIMDSPYGGWRFEENQILARKIGNEVIKVANAYGIALTEKMLEDDIKQNCIFDPKSKCSMVQDFEAFRKTENDFFLGTIINLAKEKEISVVYSEFLYLLINGAQNAWQYRK